MQKLLPIVIPCGWEFRNDCSHLEQFWNFNGKISIYEQEFAVHAFGPTQKYYPTF
jgi:hypothetical protein